MHDCSPFLRSLPVFAVICFPDSSHSDGGQDRTFMFSFTFPWWLGMLIFFHVTQSFILHLLRIDSLAVLWFSELLSGFSRAGDWSRAVAIILALSSHPTYFRKTLQLSLHLLRKLTLSDAQLADCGPLCSLCPHSINCFFSYEKSRNPSCQLLTLEFISESVFPY